MGQRVSTCSKQADDAVVVVATDSSVLQEHDKSGSRFFAFARGAKVAPLLDSTIVNSTKESSGTHSPDADNGVQMKKPTFNVQVCSTVSPTSSPNPKESVEVTLHKSSDEDDHVGNDEFSSLTMEGFPFDSDEIAASKSSNAKNATDVGSTASVVLTPIKEEEASNRAATATPKAMDGKKFEWEELLEEGGKLMESSASKTDDDELPKVEDVDSKTDVMAEESADKENEEKIQSVSVSVSVPVLVKKMMFETSNNKNGGKKGSKRRNKSTKKWNDGRTLLSPRKIALLKAREDAVEGMSVKPKKGGAKKYKMIKNNDEAVSPIAMKKLTL